MYSATAKYSMHASDIGKGANVLFVKKKASAGKKNGVSYLNG